MVIETGSTYFLGSNGSWTENPGGGFGGGGGGGSGSAAGALKPEIVPLLPSQGEAGKMYLVSNGGIAPDQYDEFVWVNGQYETIGGSNGGGGPGTSTPVFVPKNRPPTDTDNTYPAGTIWMDTVGRKIYFLLGLNGGQAIWEPGMIQSDVAGFGDMDTSVFATNGDASQGYVDKAVTAAK
jgi:hypothetical protein